MFYDGVTFQVRKNDFILHIKNANLSKHFECADPESELHWNNLAVTAFKYVLLGRKISSCMLPCSGCLTRTMMAT